MKFWKMHGAENDFVLFDARHDARADWSRAAIEICDRRRGIGADGVLLVKESLSELRMEVINADGTQAAMCGNGLRCFAVLCRDLGLMTDAAVIQTGSGPRHVEVLEDGLVRIGMGVPTFQAPVVLRNPSQVEWIDQNINGVPVTAVSMGNPHLVWFMDEDPLSAHIYLAEHAQSLQRSDELREPANVNFAWVVARDDVRLATYERGVGFTQACGTGACATVAAGIRTDRLDSRVRVTVPGGSLLIEQLSSGEMRMTGPTAYSFTGEWKFSDAT